MSILVSVLLAAAVLGALAVVAAYVLGWANQAFNVEVDPREFAVAAILPNVNCGSCGYVGCGEYAAAVAAGKAEVNLCAPGGQDCARRVAEIMGVGLEPSFPYRAVVHCAARTDQRRGRSDYQGEPTCAAANLVADVQGCTYGCLGMGDCERACPYDAIHVVDGLATVDYHKCIGCKKCAKACPRHIITMVPFKAERMLVVACSNKDFGPEVRDVCEVGCIGCQACSKHAEPMEMAGHLPVINYDAYASADQFALAVEKCPRESLLFIGKPTPADLAAVAEEPLPERVEADFQTTVDDTEWRG
ncbi:MAG TPA: RnfABCDGE type electron transport complex subunit B [Thermoguttaceae bacterium]|nr:RnfABCDGE type electron transport complex subunit B [Thermoguttaceae bacterium]